MIWNIFLTLYTISIISSFIGIFVLFLVGIAGTLKTMEKIFPWMCILCIYYMSAIMAVAGYDIIMDIWK